MDFGLTPEQIALRRAIIEFSRNELNLGATARDRAQSFPRDLWLKCGELGLQGLPVPERYGGTGLDPLSTALALEAFGYSCHDGGLVFSICAHLLACVVPIWQYGSEEQRQRLLPRLANGSLIAVNAMTESSSGSDVFAMATRAVPDGDGFRITGHKTFSSNGPVADLALVYADVTGDTPGARGITAFVVEAGTAGVRVGQAFEKMGLRSAPISNLVFDDVRVSREAMLGKPGAGPTIFADSMNWERVCLGAVHVGTMERLLETAIAYARTRHSAGKPIGKFQAVAHHIADMKVRLEATRLVAYRAASRLRVARDVALDASITKVLASEAFLANALGTLRVLGGYGYMEEYEVERAVRDAVGSVLYSGTSEVQRNIIARWLGL